jgi:MinD superfamily P-loop ATPase
MYIAVASGKGGTGKTLISTSLALSSGKCTYIDLDVEEPNGYIFLKPKVVEEIKYRLAVPEIDEGICTFCERCSRSCMYHALTVIPSIKKTIVFSDLCHSCGVCSYVCPVNGALKEVQKEIGTITLGNSGGIRFIEGKLRIGQPSGVPLISGILTKYLNDEDLIIVDSSPGTSCPVVESIKGSDYIILVTEPTPFGLNDLSLMVEIVKDLNKKSGIIINKDNGEFNLIDDFAKEENITILYRIPYSIKIQESYSRGVPIIESLPGLKKDFEDILRQLIANE